MTAEALSSSIASLLKNPARQLQSRKIRK